MSLVLLVGAGLFLRSWQQTLAVDPGFGRAPTAILSVMVPVAGTTPEAADQRTRRLLERFRTLPGVEAVGLVWPLPLELSSSYIDVTIDGRIPPPGHEAFRAERAYADGRFFDAAGMRIVSGRTFDESDRRGSRPVAVISQAMARRYWPDGNALGRILRTPDPGQPDLTIVGIASDINVRSLGEAPRDVVYLPYTQSLSLPGFSFVVRTATIRATVAGAGRRRTAARSGPARDADDDDGAASGDVEAAVRRSAPSCSTAFAVLGLALAAVGVYGLVRYTVARRTREVGIRMALGADAAGVARLLATSGVRLVLVGRGDRCGRVAARGTPALDAALRRRAFDPLAFDRRAARARRRGVAGGLSPGAARQPRQSARGSAQRVSRSTPAD